MLSMKEIVPAARNNINMQFIVLDKGKITLEGQNRTCLALVADETASVHFQLWNEECDAFQPGDIVRLSNGIFSYNRNNHLVLRAGKRGKIEKVGEFNMTFVESPNMSEIVWVPDPNNPAITYSIAMTQQTQYVVFQALQSNRRFFHSNFRIPAASYTVFTMLTLVIFVPIYDRLIVPHLRRITGKNGGISLLQRIGFGISLTILASLVSGLVKEKRRNLALTKPPLGYEPHRGAISSMSALWLVPQLSLAGFAEAFTSIGLVEFYYKQFPENMRSVAGAFFFCGTAASSYLNGFLVMVIHRTTEGAATGNWLPEDLTQW